MCSRSLVCAFLILCLAVPVTSRTAAQDEAVSRSTGTLIGGLQSEDVEVRRHTVLMIWESDRETQQRALAALIELLADEKDVQVRLAVFDTFRAMGPDAAPAVEALVQSMRTDHGIRRDEEVHSDYRSALALAAIGKQAVEGLRSLLSESEENVREKAAMSLERIGPDAACATPDLVHLLGDEQEDVRRAASNALAQIGAAAVEPLIAASAEPNVMVRAAAVNGLGSSIAPNERVKEIVRKRTEDTAVEVRAAAIPALAALLPIDETLLSVLTENIRHEDEGVRVAVVNVLVGEQRQLLEQLEPELQSLLTHEHDGIARHAAFLLQSIGMKSAPTLLNALRDKRSYVEQIANALTLLGRPVTPLLLTAIDDSEPRVRSGAALALGQIRPLAPGAIEVLTAGLEDSDREVQLAFLSSIGRLGRRAGASVPAVRTKLNHESAAVRIQAIDILFQAAPRDSQVVDDVTTMLKDGDPRVRRHAIDTLRSLGPLGRSALPVVVEQLQDTNLEIRLAAARMISSHGRAAIEAVGVLSNLLADPSPELRAVIAKTLGQLGEAAQPAFSQLTLLLHDTETEVRSMATLAIAGLNLEVTEVRPFLSQALQDEESDVRRAAMRAIRRYGRRSAIFLPDLILLAANESNRRFIGRLLRRYERSGPDAQSIPELIELLNHEHKAVRLLAIRFLGIAGQGATMAIEALKRLNEDPSEEVRTQAQVAIEQIKSNPPPEQLRRMDDE